MQMIHPVFNTAIQGNDDVPEDIQISFPQIMLVVVVKQHDYFSLFNVLI